MKILILAHNLRSGGGISVAINFIRSLIRSMEKHEYFFVVPDLQSYQVLDYGNHMVYFFRYRNLAQRLWFDYFTLRKIHDQFHPDRILGLGNFGLRKVGTPQAILLHEPHLVKPEKSGYTPTHPFDRLLAFIKKYRFKHMLFFVHLVFCQTKSMQSQFLNRYRFRGRTEILPNVLSEYIQHFEKGEKHLNHIVPEVALKQKNKFKLFQLGKYYPHKNFELGIQLFKNNREKLQDVVLIITVDQSDDRGARKLLKEIEKYSLSEHIINVGHIDQRKLQNYFLSCNALFFPTLTESFSATYLEAMYFDLPILTSDLDFAHEICDEAALYFDPRSPDAALEAILRIKNNEPLRSELTEKGKVRLGHFIQSWDTVASKTIAAMETLEMTRT